MVSQKAQPLLSSTFAPRALEGSLIEVRLLGLNLYQFSQCPQHRTWWRDGAGCSAELPGGWAESPLGW